MCICLYTCSNTNLFTHSDYGISEVFSRRQNPQQWYVYRRGLGESEDRAGQACLEVGRKDSSLPDIDNLLVGLVKNFKE